MKSLKHLALAALVVASLLLPLATRRPQPASADQPCFVQPGYLDVSGSTLTLHSYVYDMYCITGQKIHVSASYDVSSTTAHEDVGVDFNPSFPTFSTGWNCTGDPWIATTLTPNCTPQYGQFSLPSPWFEFILLAPFSATYLNDAAHALFAAQLQNATLKYLPVGEVFTVKNDSTAAAILLGTTPAPAPASTLPDLAVVSITGPATRLAGLSGTYTVTIKNQGGTAAPVELFILFAGKLDQTGQFPANCELKAGDPGIKLGVDLNEPINEALRCTGDTLAPGQTATVVVQARGQTVGDGKLAAAINPSHTVIESDDLKDLNNFFQLKVAVN